MSRPDRAAVTGWRKPWIDPPPKGRKLFILTKGRIATIGHWGKDCCAWAPLFNVDDELNDYVFACYLGLGREWLEERNLNTSFLE